MLLGLASAWSRIQKHIEEATHALLTDDAPKDKGLGTAVGGWLKTIGGKLGEAGLKIGTAAAKELITQWMLQYWGLKS